MSDRQTGVNLRDVSVEAGDVVLVRSDPRDVPRIIALSRASYRKMGFRACVQRLGKTSLRSRQ